MTSMVGVSSSGVTTSDGAVVEHMSLEIVIPERDGVCRWCSLSDRDGAAWANARHTLCTACVSLDRDARTVHGRRRIADRYRLVEANQ
jgi:hypothetical protein